MTISGGLLLAAQFRLGAQWSNAERVDLVVPAIMRCDDASLDRSWV